MKRFGQILLIGLLIVGISGVAFGQASPTLDKIKNSGVFTLGVRNGSPPFSFINRQNERVGFSNDLAELVHKAIEKKLGKSIKLEMKETTPVHPHSLAHQPGRGPHYRDDDRHAGPA